jgi:inorganic pyrophosphatase
MNIRPWHDVCLPVDPTKWFPAFIEVPKGSHVKYELDHSTSLLIVCAVMDGALQFPANYGFVPRTWSEDGEALDVFVLGRSAVVAGTLMRARAIGVIRMRHRNGEDDKLIAVPVDDPDFLACCDVRELPAHHVSELLHFFQSYKILEQEELVDDCPLGTSDALAILSKAIDRYARYSQDLVVRSNGAMPYDLHHWERQDQLRQ